MTVYKIIFKGEITNESNRPKIEKALAAFFKIPIEKASVLFNGNSFALKKGLEVDQAISLQQKLSTIGIMTHLIKEEVVVDDITTQTKADVNEQLDNDDDSAELGLGSIDVDDKLKEKFKLALQIERGELPDNLGEKIKCYVKNFNLWAFFLAVPYLLYKRLWAALFIYITLIFSVDIFLVATREIHGKLSPFTGVSIAAGIYLGHCFYRIQYYSLVKTEHPWSMALSYVKVKGAICLTILVGYFSLLNYSFFPEDTSGVWYSESLKQEVTIDLIGSKKNIVIGNKAVYPVKKIHGSIFAQTLSVTTCNLGDCKNKVKWLLEKESYGLFDFGVVISVQGGEREELDWVREL